eukprot:scaffold305545_cov36-Prasinocladus_malaysianus.AAC.1
MITQQECCSTTFIRKRLPCPDNGGVPGDNGNPNIITASSLPSKMMHQNTKASCHYSSGMAIIVHCTIRFVENYALG